MLLPVLHLMPDDSRVGQIVERLMAARVPGSFLAISHPASDIDAAQTPEERLHHARY